MKREFLKELGIEEEVINKIMAENGKDIENEKAKLTTKDKEIEVINKQLQEANKSIKSYKDMDIEAIKKSASEWEEKFKTSTKELEDFKNNTALEKAMAEHKVIDTDIMLKIIDKSSLKFSKDGIEGLKEQIETLKTSKPYLFKSDDNTNNADSSNNSNSANGMKPYTPETSSGEGISGMEATINNIFK